MNASIKRTMASWPGWALLATLSLAVFATGAAAAKGEFVVVERTAVLLGDALPDSIPVAPPMRVEQEAWDVARLSEVFGQDAAPLDLADGVSVDGEGSRVRLGDGGLVRLGARKAGFYVTFAATGEQGTASPVSSCDASRAVELAGAYVAAHGGMPADAELWGVREVVAVGLSLDDEGGVRASGQERRRSEGYYVEFRHAVGGIPIDSPDGSDCIKVRLDAAGRVRAYGRTWRSVLSEQFGASSRCIAPREALVSGLRSGGLGLTKGRISGTVRLKDARMVYLSASRDSDVDVMRPAWRFVLETGSGSQEFFVDAANGQAVTGE
jgi:hypothetical protein